MLNTSHNVVKIIGTFLVALALSRVAEAGQPLICHPFDAGEASVLPWGKGMGWKTPDPSYDLRRLTAETLRLLTPDAPILARMENMRRATIYASQDRRVAAELLAAVLERARTAAARGSRDPLAWFDAGYLIESYRQAGPMFRWDMLSVVDRSSWVRSDLHALDGYGLVRKAIALAGSSPDMEFAASLMQQGAASADHRRRAVAGAAAGSLLAKNLAK